MSVCICIYMCIRMCVRIRYICIHINYFLYLYYISALINFNLKKLYYTGLVAFFLFNSIASNLKLNRLVRFNIQQAIFLDIALIFPGIIGKKHIHILYVL
jgi:hypothetical protein